MSVVQRIHRMHKTHLVFRIVLAALTAGLFSCAGTPSGGETRLSIYRFRIEGENYRIRSILSEEKNQNRNELISDYFLAVDYDQDRIIDQVLMGSVPLAEAQRVYDFGLKQLEDRDRLRIVSPNVRIYSRESACCYYEIKSFRPAGDRPFNEFQIIKRPYSSDPEIAIGLDRDADGRIDEIIRGDMSVEQIHEDYRSMIESGLDASRVIEKNGKFLVAEPQ